MASNHESICRSPDSFSLFRDVEVELQHRILLSWRNVDKYMKLPKNWSFEKFKQEIKSQFHELNPIFKLIDADFLEMNEESFKELQNSAAKETWLLVQESDHTNDNHGAVLDRPSYELLKYDVHPNALTQSGNYHFSSCYQAFCEFIDNSVQATNNNPISRDIKLHVFEDWKIVCIFDNGAGMTSEGMKAFASYFLSQEDRGLEKGSSNTYGYLDGNISKFGVGATQAGFYLGDTIKVITKKADSKFVTEISISKKKLHERAKKNLPVFEDYKCIRSPGDVSTLDISELCLKTLVEKEKENCQFTSIVISGMKAKHLAYMVQNDGKNLARDLAHVYHYYLHGIKGSFSRLQFHKMNDFTECDKMSINLTITLHERRGTDFEISVKDIDDDVESLYQKNAKSVFPFCLELNLLEKKQIVQGCLLYFPNELGEETLPKSTDQIDEDGNKPMFDCFWQGRLAPQSYVNKLDFFGKPENRKRKQRDVLPDICFQRVRGLLFFNRNTPVSNNKLKILLDTSRDLSDALSSASSSKRNLPQAFRQWLEECHRSYDKDIVFTSPLPKDKQPNNGDLLCAGLKFVNSAGDVTYSIGDTVKIDTRPVAYGKILYFILKGKLNEPGTVVYTKLPEEVYGDAQEERPVMRIAGKPDLVTLNKYLTAEMVHMPKSIKVFEGDNRVSQVPDLLEFRAGEEMKAKTHFWVGICNGEKPEKNIVEVHQKKLGVRVHITGRNPLTNSSPVSKLYGFKPFYLDKVGKYIVTFSVVIGNQPCGVEKQIEIDIKPNVAEIVNLLENTPDNVPLGENVISFTLSFHDIFENPTTMFKGNKDEVILTCTAKHLEIIGLKDRYKPNKDGILNVSGISVIPSTNQISLTNDYEFWVVAENIGDVMFAIKLITGPPCKVQTTKLESLEFENYDNFPEIDVKVLDKFNQPSVVTNNDVKLALICDAFATPILTSSISNGKAKFPTTPIKVDNMKETISQDVRISLVIPESRKKKTYIAKVIKELLKFEVKVIPSRVFSRIEVVQCQPDKQMTDPSEGCLSLNAIAGSVVNSLKVVGFDESDRQLTDEEFLSHEPHVTVTWSEVNKKNLPLLPDCPVTNIIQVNVQNVQCFCRLNGFEIRTEAKLRISVIPGSPVRWSLQPLRNTTIISGKKKGLADAIKITALDKHHNPTCLEESFITPLITVAHADSQSNVAYTGSLLFKKNSYCFTPASLISGVAGQINVTVHDQNNILIKDTMSIELTCGPPEKIAVSCKSFDERPNEKPNTSFLRMYTRSAIPYPIVCVIQDCHGNATETKTTLLAQWNDASVGKSLTRVTKDNGEAIFPANSIRCMKDVEKAKLTIIAPDLSVLKPYEINVVMMQCNRVKKINASTEGPKILTASSDFPVIKISHETEDMVPVPNFFSNLSVEFKKPSGDYISLPNVYPPSQQTTIDNVVTLIPVKGHQFEEAGLWAISCKYTETRPTILQISGTKVLISSCELNVKADDTAKFVLSLGETTKLLGSSTSDIRGRTLIPTNHIPTKKAFANNIPTNVFLYAVDEFGNNTSLQTRINLYIKPEEEKEKDVVLPALENQCLSFEMVDGKIELPPIILKENVGNKIGDYLLVFSNNQHKPCLVKFSFSTNEELDKITQELEPLRNELVSLGNIVNAKQKELETHRTKVNVVLRQLSQYFETNEPEIPLIDIQIAKIRNSTYDFEQRETHLRKARKDRNYPPQSVRQYIKGLVCELAYVSDEELCRILSWYAQGKLKVALCETKEQQRKVYNLGVPVYSENLISKYQRQGYNAARGGLLPLDLPTPPSGFRSPINFAVNLLQFSEENAYLRSSLFYSVFSNTIVLSDLEHAQVYREHLVKHNRRCPAILTMKGDLIASDGLMDPNRKCPSRLDQLRFTFGELPHTGEPEYQKLLCDLHKLEELRKTTFDLSVSLQEVKQCEIDFRQRRNVLQPRINQLQTKLQSARLKVDAVKDRRRKSSLTSPANKRKRK